jgi:hypothetical protein
MDVVEGEILRKSSPAGIVNNANGGGRPTQTSHVRARHASVYDAGLHAASLHETALFGGDSGHFAASLTMRTPGSACSSTGGTQSTGAARSIAAGRGAPAACA